MTITDSKTLITPDGKYVACDLMCGAGGSSSGIVEGIRLATGRDLRLTVVNHNPNNLYTHALNLPDARHVCDDIYDLDYGSLFQSDEKVFVGWASPSCVGFSKARGGKPTKPQQRATALCVTKFARIYRPLVLLCENVPEFKRWGPCYPVGHPLAGHPIPEHEGEAFLEWEDDIRSMGYRWAHTIICCADYGDPTTRVRWFGQAVLAPRKVCWPNPTHAKVDERGKVPKGMRRHVAASKILDLSLRGTSVWNRDKYGKADIRENSLRRILHGLNRYGAEAFFTDNFGERSGQEPRTRAASKPVGAVTSRGAGNLVQAEAHFIVKARGTGRSCDVKKSLDAVTAGGNHYWLVNMKGQSKSMDPTKPVPGVTAHARHVALAKLEAFLMEANHGNDRPSDDNRRVKKTNKPLGALTQRNGLAVVQPFVINIDQAGSNGNCVRSTKRSLGTVITASNQTLIQSMLPPMVMGQQGGAAARSVRKNAVPTVAQAGAVSLITPLCILPKSRFGYESIRDVKKPVQTIDATSWNIGLVQGRAFLTKYYSNTAPDSVDDALNAVTTKSRFGLAVTAFQLADLDWKISKKTIKVDKVKYSLIEVDGWRYLPLLFIGQGFAAFVLCDVYYRMLTTRELARAQGFDDSFRFKGTSEQITSQIGNAVPRNTARALIMAAVTQNPDVPFIKTKWKRTIAEAAPMLPPDKPVKIKTPA